MMHVAWPWMALLLPVPWLLYSMRPAARPGGAAIFLLFISSLDSANAGSDRIRLTRRTLFVLTWILLIAAAVRPQWLGDPLPIPSARGSVEKTACRVGCQRFQAT